MLTNTNESFSGSKAVSCLFLFFHGDPSVPSEFVVLSTADCFDVGEDNSFMESACVLISSSGLDALIWISLRLPGSIEEHWCLVNEVSASLLLFPIVQCFGHGALQDDSSKSSVSLVVGGERSSSVLWLESMPEACG